MVDVKTDGEMKEFAEMLDTVSDKLPKILRGIIDNLYSVESATNMGKAVGSLYKELIASGIPEDAALKMAMDYMLSAKDLSKMGTNK